VRQEGVDSESGFHHSGTCLGGLRMHQIDTHNASGIVPKTRFTMAEGNRADSRRDHFRRRAEGCVRESCDMTRKRDLWLAESCPLKFSRGGHGAITLGSAIAAQRGFYPRLAFFSAALSSNQLMILVP